MNQSVANQFLLDNSLILKRDLKLKEPLSADSCSNNLKPLKTNSLSGFILYIIMLEQKWDNKDGTKAGDPDNTGKQFPEFFRKYLVR